MKSSKPLVVTALAAGLALWGSAHGIQFYNLTHINGATGLSTPNANNTAIINGAIFSTLPNDTTVGTGVLDPFIRIQATNGNALNINQGANCNNNTGEGCVEVGYNTDGKTDNNNAVQFQEHNLQGHNWNHTIKLADMQKDCSGTGADQKCYYSFVLDINERHNGGQGDSKLDQFLSLDQFRIFTDAGGPVDSNLEGYTFAGDLTSGPAGKATYDPRTHQLGGRSAVFDMDLSYGNPCGGAEPTGADGSPSKPWVAGTAGSDGSNDFPDGGGGYGGAGNPICDRTVGLNYALNSGSGKGVDLVVKVPDHVFANASNVYLFSSFGELGINRGKDDGTNKPAGNLPSGDFSQSAGFEEWSYKRNTPVAPTLALLTVGLVAMGGMRRLGARSS